MLVRGKTYIVYEKSSFEIQTIIVMFTSTGIRNIHISIGFHRNKISSNFFEQYIVSAVKLYVYVGL